MSSTESASSRETGLVPKTGIAGLIENFRYDSLAGFLVFLIALPLCLAIAKASGFPPIAGIFTAIIGSVVTTLISNSELTIKGPAAGMIVIVLGCVNDFGYTAGADPAADLVAYQSALAVGVAAGFIQIAFGLFRSGILGEFFPISTVHGMLAAIGVIIISKQLPVLLGVSGPLARGEPLQLLARIPQFIQQADPEISLIGFLGLLILFGLPLIKNKYVRRIPAPMIVLLVAVPLGIVFQLADEHTYTFLGHSHKLLPRDSLVDVPDRFLGAFTLPMFDALRQPIAWKWILMYALVGSLESLLSAKAVDLIDPWKRKTNLNRDLLGVGVANTLAAMAGGLPMISEIVRSRANVNNGARTRYADLFHGICLLAFVALAPTLIHRIPLSALAAMLIYTGFRLASPKEFLHMFRIGREQLVIYISTILGVVGIDLLAGVAIGIAVKFAIHIINGVPIRTLFKPYLQIEPHDDYTVKIVARQSAVFSNWIPFKRQIESFGLIERKNVIVDLHEAKFVDHSVMEKLHEMERDFENAGLKLEVQGLDEFRQFSDHPLSARKRGLQPIRRLTIITVPQLQERLTENLAALGATGYTTLPCFGAGRQQMEENHASSSDRIRVEVLVPAETADRILMWLRREIIPHHAVTACVEQVEVLRASDFSPQSDLVKKNGQPHRA